MRAHESRAKHPTAFAAALAIQIPKIFSPPGTPSSICARCPAHPLWCRDLRFGLQSTASGVLTSNFGFQFTVFGVMAIDPGLPSTTPAVVTSDSGFPPASSGVDRDFGSVE